MGTKILNGKEIKEHESEVLDGKNIIGEAYAKLILHSPILSGKRINETAENPEISADRESKFLRTQNPQIKSGKRKGQIRRSERLLFVLDVETGNFGYIKARWISNGGVYLRASEFEKLASVQPASSKKKHWAFKYFQPVSSKSFKIKVLGENFGERVPHYADSKSPSGFTPVLSLRQKTLMKLNPIAIARRVWRSIYFPKIFAGRWVTVRGEYEEVPYKVRVRITSLTPHGLDIIIGASTVEEV